MAEPGTLAAITAVGSLLGGAGAVFSALKSPPKPTPFPEQKAPAVMPTRDDAASRQAEQRRIAAIRSRSGRASTILSDVGSGDKLGAA